MEEEEELFASLIKKCPNMRLLRQLHARILTRHLPISTYSFALSKIVGFCALSPLGDVHYARQVFLRISNPSIFSWNSLIRGCSQIENPSKEPILLFRRLIERGNPSPNTFTLAFVLKACAVVSAFEEGMEVHSRVFRSGFSSSPFIQTALINLYAKCEQIFLAEKVFDEITDRNLVAWSTMISGYARVGLVNEAMDLFRKMQEEGIEPDEVTLASVMSACAIAGALDIGKWVHAYIEKHTIKPDLELNTALVNMYAKCGSIERAKQVFDEMPVKDTKAWSSMIMGFAIHGLSEDALVAFSAMVEAKVIPNQVSFIGVLSACAHGGLLSEGRKFWSIMVERRMAPSIEHYGCMVNLLCRAGQINEAYALVKAMIISPNPVILRTLLVGCKKEKLLCIGESVAKDLLELEPLNAENYVLVSNFYASVSQWEKMSRARKAINNKGIKVSPGCSSIEVDGLIHEFKTGTFSHPDTKILREIMREMSDRVRKTGYRPNLSNVLQNVIDEEKEKALEEHSERFAIAYGLLKTQPASVIRVVKNLRVCEDCHEVTKIISRIYQREIIVRDRVRFHKFVDGICSCKDFW